MPERYGLEVEARQADGIPLDVRFACGTGDVLAIHGPSGAGKTTILRTIAGLYTPAHAIVSSRAITWTDTRSRKHMPTNKRPLGVLFQDYALFPHMTARGNVAAALGAHPRAERAALADRWLATVRLAGLEDRRPAELSGGQQQRVALARALARTPDVLLLDEPFAAVDPAVRASLHDELDRLRHETGVPVVLVTHNLADVRRLATHVLAIDAGRIVSSGTVADLSARLDAPWCRDAADAGSVIEATVDTVDEATGLAALVFEGGTFLATVAAHAVGARVRIHVPARDVVLATARPSALSLHNVLEGTVRAIAPLDGARVIVQVQVGDAILLAEVTRDAVSRLALAPGAQAFALVKSVSLDVQAAPAD